MSAKECPRCHGFNIGDAQFCVFCHQTFSPQTEITPSAKKPDSTKLIIGFGVLGVVIIAVIIIGIVTTRDTRIRVSDIAASDSSPAQTPSQTPTRNPDEIALGKKPVNSPFDGSVMEVKQYLRRNLNDYDSCEFVEWSEVTKVEVAGQKYWGVKLRLRAKNAFGAYIVKDTYFFIRDSVVVRAEGL